MALRIEKRIGALLTLGAAIAFAQPFTFAVRHQHLRGGVAGTLKIDGDAIAFTEPGKDAKHSREWQYADIQQLTLGPAELRILTYEDRKWQLGRDRDYVFDHLPADLARQVNPMFARSLDQRFVAALADPEFHPLWQTGVKLRHRLGGSQGMLLVGEDRIVYQTSVPGESRTWRLQDIDSVATGGSFDLAITTLERSDWRHAGPTEFRFQLKEALAEDRYNDLWRRIRQSTIGPSQ